MIIGAFTGDLSHRLFGVPEQPPQKITKEEMTTFTGFGIRNVLALNGSQDVLQKNQQLTDKSIINPESGRVDGSITTVVTRVDTTLPVNGLKNGSIDLIEQEKQLQDQFTIASDTGRPVITTTNANIGIGVDNITKHPAIVVVILVGLFILWSSKHAKQ